MEYTESFVNVFIFQMAIKHVEKKQFEEQWGNTLLKGQILEKSMKTSTFVCNEYLRF